jgi:thioredoxin reductase (NADPH)
VTAFLHDWLRSRAPEAPVARIVGDSVSRRSYELRNLLSRHRIDHVFLSVGSHEAQEVIGRLVSKHDVLPAVELFDGRVLVDPSNAELAAALGLKTRLPQNKGFDVVVIGGGPAGLSAAVYGASEGLRTLVVERQAIGGQAGTSSLIRNYVGFARGVSGSELAQQAYQQAWVFGATFLMTREATGIRQNGNGFIVELGHGEQALARTIVLTTGVSYRRLNVPNLEPLIGAGVFYGASLAEAQAMQGRDVFIVGGGNSAGQAATYLSTYASRVTIMVRSESLAESMSDYLIREIDAASNIDVRFRTEVVDGGGEGRLQYLVLADSESRREERVEADALFILIGAEPFTDWLPREIERDRWGFILTGSDLAERRSSQSRDALDLETSVPGVFAAGDVRHGSVKRVASAVGEGSIAIRLVHEHLERQGIVRSQRAP